MPNTVNEADHPVAYRTPPSYFNFVMSTEAAGLQLSVDTDVETMSWLTAELKSVQVAKLYSCQHLQGKLPQFYMSKSILRSAATHGKM